MKQDSFENTQSEKINSWSKLQRRKDWLLTWKSNFCFTKTKNILIYLEELETKFFHSDGIKLLLQSK